MPPVSKKIKKPIDNNFEDDEDIKGDKVISAQLQKKLDRREKNRKKRPERGVVLIRHLPHGFFEEQLKNYFEQFGEVTRLRLARSRKTGNGKGFAFIEYAIPDVAKVAAESMDNYLMFKKIVKAHYIPPEEQKYNYFKSKVKQVTTPLGKNIYISGKTKIARFKVKLNNKWNQKNYEKRTKNSIKKLNKLKKKYADLGLNFDDITIAPKLVPFKVNTVKDENEETVANTSEVQSEDNEEAGSLLLIKKRKRSILKQKENVKVPKLTAATTTKTELKQLLDKTLEDESTSEDEDYIPSDSDEENLKMNFIKELNEIESDDDDGSEIDSGDEETDNTVTSSDDDDDENDNIQKPVPKILKPKTGLEKIICRKSNVGGIKKPKTKMLKSKSTKNKPINIAKEKMINNAAKEILKSTKIKQSKNIDLLKMKGKKQK